MRAHLVLSFTLCWLLSGCAKIGDLPAFIQNSDTKKKNPQEWGICSSLSFSDMAEPPWMTPEERMAFAVALNLTGSYEGPDGWQNITNNFDDMGLSLGLLNQTLGTGSLQPLLLQMRDRHQNIMESIFPKEHWFSLQSMLKQWELPEVRQVESKNYSYLDVEFFEQRATVPGRNARSAQWAQDQLHHGTDLKADWKMQFQSMAAHPSYKWIQFIEALNLHSKALDLFHEYEMTQLRSYLFFFDIVVQNGSIPDMDRIDYRNFLRLSPNAGEEERLFKILELRLRHVRKQYVGDVRRRKTAIILTKGRVHNQDRDFDQEYCVALMDTLNLPTLPGMP